MKMYLSSYRIPHSQSLLDLIGKPKNQIKAAMITNAKDYYAPRARNFKITKAIQELSDTLPSIDAIDLHTFVDAQDVAATLKKYDILWVVGGNTFCLRYAMKASGFDKVISQLLEDGLVYAGDSAGAVVVGPTLKGVEGEDEPQFSEEVIWEGLGLISEFIMPHADNDLFAASLPNIRKIHAENPLYVEINDDEAIIVSAGQAAIITASGKRSAINS